MGFFKKAEHFFEDHILHPGKGTKSDDWKGTDPMMAAEGIAEIVLAPEITFGSVAEIAAKQLGKAVGNSLYGTAKKKTRVVKRKVSKAVRVPYTGKSQLNSAMKGGNRRMAQIPDGAKRVYDSRYFEVYEYRGKKYLWGKPTLGPNSFREDPMGFAREWVENVQRARSPKYRRSDPLEKDMAKIKQKFGRMDHISGYSRGAAAARYQRADKNTTSRIFGSYTPYAGIGNHRKRRRRKFDPVHVGARGITRYTYAKNRAHNML